MQAVTQLPSEEKDKTRGRGEEVGGPSWKLQVSGEQTQPSLLCFAPLNSPAS